MFKSVQFLKLPVILYDAICRCRKPVEHAGGACGALNQVAATVWADKVESAFAAVFAKRAFEGANVRTG